MTLFEPVLQHANAHGAIAGVPLPDSPAPVPEQALARLASAEREHARSLRGYRQVEFVGGRIALRAARRQLSAPLDACLSDARGAPIMPPGLVGSVSHKRTLAVAMVAADDGSTLGVDLEDYGPPRLRIADRVLREEEMATLHGLSDERRWIAIVLRFSIKEAIYKALDPWVHRFVGFDEASVLPELNGRAQVQLHLNQGEGPFAVDARFEWWEGRVLSSVRIRALPGAVVSPACKRSISPASPP